MQKSDNTKQAKVTQRRVASSTTLNRKYVRRPSIGINTGASVNQTAYVARTANTDVVAPIKRSPRIRRFGVTSTTAASRPHKINIQDTAQTIPVARSARATNYSQTTEVKRDLFVSHATTPRTTGAMQFTQPVTQASQPVQIVQPIPVAQPVQPVQPTQLTQVIPEMQSLQETVEARMQMRAQQPQPVVQQLPAKELKDQAIQKALASASAPSTVAKSAAKRKKAKKGLNKVHFGMGRVVLALSCAAVAVMAIVYFVNLNMPDISLKVAAMQTGINAAYPGYVPRDFALASITSEDKKVTMEFKNSSAGDAFTLIEETSSWDSDALLNNYVKVSYKDNYTMIKEQGLTIFISGSDACWVNGGIVYKITTKSGSLTNKQIKSIATSL